jgi:hypothetical protein
MLNTTMTAAIARAKEAGQHALVRRLQCELAIVHALVKAGLAAGYTVGVNDGEEWTVRHSRNRAEIMEALFSTDADTIRFRNPNATPHAPKVADFDLIYGNSGYDVISDYTANDEAEALIAAIQPAIDRWEARIG